MAVGESGYIGSLECMNRRVYDTMSDLIVGTITGAIVAVFCCEFSSCGRLHDGNPNIFMDDAGNMMLSKVFSDETIRNIKRNRMVSAEMQANETIYVTTERFISLFF